MIVAVGGSFVAFLDATITNLAIPSLAHQFRGTGFETLTWVIMIYAVTFAAFLAPAGRVADLVGRRHLYLAGVLIFGASSLLCALAPGLAVLLTARALQGVGAACLVPASLAVVLMDTPAKRRAATIGLWSAGAAAAAAVGPSLGGVLVDAFGWRSLFVVNVPITILLALVAIRLRRSEGTPGRLPDLVGTALLTAGVAALVLSVSEGRSWGWTSHATIAFAVAGAVGLVWALRRASRHEVPAVETALWRNPTYATANVFSVLLGAALYAWMLLGVLFLVSVWHYSELRAGLAMSPGALAAAAVGISIGRVSRKPSPWLLGTAGAIDLALVAGALALWVPTRPEFVAVWFPAGVLSGIAFGAMSVATSSAAALSVRPQRFAGAVGLNVAARQAGGALGIAVLASLLGAGSGDLSAFKEVYVFAFAVAALAAVAGVGLRQPLHSSSLAPTPVLSAAGTQEPSR